MCNLERETLVSAVKLEPKWLLGISFLVAWKRTHNDCVNFHAVDHDVGTQRACTWHAVATHVVVTLDVLPIMHYSDTISILSGASDSACCFTHGVQTRHAKYSIAWVRMTIVACRLGPR